MFAFIGNNGYLIIIFQIVNYNHVWKHQSTLLNLISLHVLWTLLLSKFQLLHDWVWYWFIWVHISSQYLHTSTFVFKKCSRDHIGFYVSDNSISVLSKPCGLVTVIGSVTLSCSQGYHLRIHSINCPHHHHTNHH